VLKTHFAVSQHALIVAQIEEFVRLDFVFLDIMKINTALASN